MSAEITRAVGASSSSIASSSDGSYASGMSPFELLPSEIFGVVASFLEISDLNSLCNTSKSFNAVIKSQSQYVLPLRLFMINNLNDVGKREKGLEKILFDCMKMSNKNTKKIAQEIVQSIAKLPNSQAVFTNICKQLSDSGRPGEALVVAGFLSTQQSQEIRVQIVERLPCAENSYNFKNSVCFYENIEEIFSDKNVGQTIFMELTRAMARKNQIKDAIEAICSNKDPEGQAVSLFIFVSELLFIGEFDQAQKIVSDYLNSELPGLLQLDRFEKPIQAILIVFSEGREPREVDVRATYFGETRKMGNFWCGSNMPVESFFHLVSVECMTTDIMN